MYKISLTLSKDLDPKERPSLFSNSFVDDPRRMVYAKVSSKTRKNKVDTDHSSTLLMQRALKSDKVHSAKLGVAYN